MSNMPVYPLDTMFSDCSDWEESIVRMAFTNRGRFSKDNGNARLRANKPFKRVTTFEQGCANYVWRMLCFDLVGHGKHVCMPVCADFEISEACDIRRGYRPKWDDPQYSDIRAEERDLLDMLDDLIKRFEKDIPIEQQAGIVRWGRALGMI